MKVERPSPVSMAGSVKSMIKHPVGNQVANSRTSCFLPQIFCWSSSLNNPNLTSNRIMVNFMHQLGYNIVPNFWPNASQDVPGKVFIFYVMSI